MNMMLLRVAAATVLASGSGFTRAQTAAAPTTAVTGQVMSVVIGLALVLAVIWGAAWLVKRVAPRAYGKSSVLQVVAGAAVGQHERVVIVEVGATWLVLGVAAGGVNLLHQLPRAAAAVADPTSPDAASPFAQWLKKFIEKRNERQP
jgi:flagellar protein FliO/FliZ